MSYMLTHLRTGWHVDRAILEEEDRVVVIRFGHDWDPECMKMDEHLYSIAPKVKNMAVVYVVNISEVPDFNKMYELYDPVTVMFFYRNKHIMIDLGTGNNNKSAPSQIVCCGLAVVLTWGNQRVALETLVRPFVLTLSPLWYHSQLGAEQQARVGRHHRNRFPRRAQGPRLGHLSEGLLDQVQILKGCPSCAD
eukprot:TRINITY_DN2869_c0_g1_i2.p1 TRINITY_DN2869_c0_g1~~TRINITY_DN2869_c0_g1_i2.p1  ORF type:complete len:193 (-),score=27.85 TRINITY_DN2869_c0_g1_i2:56-634(-)